MLISLKYCNPYLKMDQLMIDFLKSKVQKNLMMTMITLKTQ